MRGRACAPGSRRTAAHPQARRVAPDALLLVNLLRAPGQRRRSPCCLPFRPEGKGKPTHLWQRVASPRHSDAWRFSMKMHFENAETTTLVISFGVGRFASASEPPFSLLFHCVLNL